MNMSGFVSLFSFVAADKSGVLGGQKRKSLADLAQMYWVTGSEFRDYTYPKSRPNASCIGAFHPFAGPILVLQLSRKG